MELVDRGRGITVVIIDSDSDSVIQMVNYIKRLRDHVVVEGVATTFEKGFELIHKKKPMVVIMEIGSDVDESIARMKRVLDRFPQICIFVTSADKSSDTILKVIRAGAAEYILRPVVEEDLDSALQKVGRLWITKPPPEAEEGRVITLFSPKGGVGSTTLATNLAANIYGTTKKPTLIVDLDLDAGDVTTFLNMKTSYTISDVTVNITRLDESFLKGVIARHESGIYVLAEPQRVREGVSIPGSDIRKLLGILKTMFSFIVIDTENVISERTMAAVEMADLILVVFIMSLPGIKHVQRYLHYFDESDIAREKIKLVVNRYVKKGDIKIEDAEKVLRHPIFRAIPNDYEAALSSLNKGIPISSYKPRSTVSTAIADLSKALLDIKAV